MHCHPQYLQGNMNGCYQTGLNLGNVYNTAVLFKLRYKAPHSNELTIRKQYFILFFFAGNVQKARRELDQHCYKFSALPNPTQPNPAQPNATQPNPTQPNIPFLPVFFLLRDCVLLTRRYPQLCGICQDQHTSFIVCDNGTGCLSSGWAIKHKT